MLAADKIEKRIEDTKLKIGKYEFTSRLFVGTGKYPSMEIMKEALSASGTEVVTVAVRRVKINETTSLLDYINTKKYKILLYRQNKELFPPGTDFVITAKEDAGGLDFRQVANELKAVLRER